VSAAADPLADTFAAARRAPGLVLLEGLHAVKHALRFGAEPLAVAAADRAAVLRLARALAPDVAERIAALAVERPLAPLVDHVPRTGVVAVARRPPFACPPASVAAPVVLLEDPRHLGNVGAVVRVAAAAGAAAVLTTGAADPWAPAALRGSAGLHFALPVGRADPEAAGPRPLVAVDPGGPALGAVALPAAPLLAFGSERHGLGTALRARADACVGIPMRPGVSSLNLATAVAVLLYAGGRGVA
jgi:RNA methyltransferase, TrmH family